MEYPAPEVRYGIVTPHKPLEDYGEPAFDRGVKKKAPAEGGGRRLVVGETPRTKL